MPYREMVDRAIVPPTALESVARTTKNIYASHLNVQVFFLGSGSTEFAGKLEERCSNLKTTLFLGGSGYGAFEKKTAKNWNKIEYYDLMSPEWKKKLVKVMASLSMSISTSWNFF